MIRQTFIFILTLGSLTRIIAQENSIDTSKYQSIRNLIKDQTFFINHGSNLEIAYRKRGVYRDEIQDYKGAIEDYTKILEFNPKDAYKIYKNIGDCLDNLKEYKAAIVNYNKAIELNPDYANGYNNRAMCKFHLEEYKEAIQDLNKEIELNPNDFEAYYNRGKSKAELKDYEGALNDFNKAIELIPKFADVSKISDIYYKLGHIDGACLDWKKAEELGDKETKEMIKRFCK